MTTAVTPNKNITNTRVVQDEKPTNVLTLPSVKKNDVRSHSKKRKVKTSVQFKKEISKKKSKKDTTEQSSITKLVKPVLVYIAADDNSLPVLEPRGNFIFSINDKKT